MKLRPGSFALLWVTIWVPIVTIVLIFISENAKGISTFAIYSYLLGYIFLLFAPAIYKIFFGDGKP